MNKSIEISELEDLIKNKPAVMVLDVRKPDARDADPTMIPGASHVSPFEVESWQWDLPRGTKIVVYCVHGHEVSQGVCATLRKSGFDARYLAGGLEAWKESRALPG